MAVLAAKLRAYSTPARCSTTAKLWEAFPPWEQLAAEFALANQPVSDLLKAQALNDLVPEALFKDIVGRPELATFEPKLRWVKAQMEYARGAAQAQHASGAEKALHAVGTEQDSPVVWYL